ncbi:ankyrin repeat-containing protein [Moumouvirus maliensis]|nr:ankyrin repeat-containing protein [Moumouvirus maliensis]
MEKYIITPQFLDEIFNNNDTNKFYNLITSKIDPCDFDNILSWCKKYDNTNLNNILFDAFNNKNIIIGNNILDHCVKISYQKLIKFIIENVLNIKQCLRLFHYCCIYGNIVPIKLLLKQGININYDNCKIFDIACRSENIEILKLLLDHGLHIDYNNDNIVSGITFIIRMKNIKIIKLFLSYGIDFLFLNKIHQEERTIKEEEIINILQDHGVNLSKIYRLLF